MFFSYRICTTSIGKILIGLIPTGYDPVNQTSSIGKFPIGSNPSKILYYSFESMEPLHRKCWAQNILPPVRFNCQKRTLIVRREHYR